MAYFYTRGIYCPPSGCILSAKRNLVFEHCNEGLILVAYILHYSTYAKGKGLLANLKKSRCFCERCCMWVSNSSPSLLVSVVPCSRDLPRKTLITSLFEICKPTCSIKGYLHTYVKTLVQMKINSLMYIDL